MLTNPEPDRNIEELSDDEVYAAILYHELELRSAYEQNDDAAATKENDDNGAVNVCLSIAMLGCLAVLWLR